LYNGEEEIGEEVELYLSDAFEQPQENILLSLLKPENMQRFYLSKMLSLNLLTNPLKKES